MDYGKVCNSILELDEKIRYVGIYNSFSGNVVEKTRTGIERHFDVEQTRKSMTQAVMRWKTRKAFADQIGEPEYSMTRYGRVNRITIPCGKDGLLMTSTEVDIHPCDIISDISSIIEKNTDDLDDKTSRSHPLGFES